jgi:hypothetical protein
MGAIRRRAAIVKLSSGRLVLLNAVPLEEPAQREVEAWGEPAFLVVPNGYHRLDLAAWKRRYPSAKVLAPDEHRAKVAERVAVDGGFDLLPPGEGLERARLDGLKVGDPIFIVESGGRRSLVVPGDVIFNVPHGSLLMRLLGSSGGPKVSPIARLILVKDKRQLAASLRALARLVGLTRIVVCHGLNIEADPAGVLELVAARLAG